MGLHRVIKMADGFTYPEYCSVLEGQLSLATGTWGSTEISTPVNVQLGKAMVLHKVQFFVDDPDDLFADDKFCEIQLTYNEQVELIAPNNHDLIDMFHEHTNLTTSGAIVYAMPWEHVFLPPLLITKDKIYLSGKQDTGATVVVYVRLFYTLRTVKQTAIMNQILNQWGPQ